MSWRVPRHRPRTSQSVAEPEINEDFEATVTEVDGHLNEHNFKANAITDPEDVDIDASIAVGHSFQEVDPGMGQGNPPPTTLPTNGFQVPNTQEWTAIDDMSDTVEVSQSLLWILGSLQQEPSNPASATVRFGMQYAIRLDGLVLYETLTGSVDRVNDKTEEALGDAGNQWAIVVEAVLDVVPGPHLVEIVCRTPKDWTLSQPATDDFWMILNRELITVELY